MEKSSIEFLRDYLLNKDRMEVFADNVRLYDDSNKHVEFIWNDELELLHCIRINQSHYNQDEKPFVIENFEYNVIQYMFNTLSLDELKEVLNKLKAKGLIDEDRFNKLLENFSTISNKLL